MKKLLTSVLALALSFSIVGSAFASDISTTPQEEKSLTNTVELLTDNNAKLGTLTTTTTYHREVKEDRLAVTVETFKDYKLNEQYANDPAYIESFQDSSSTILFELTDNNEYFIDGKLLSEDELNQPLEKASPQFSALANDSGGVPKLGHYYSANNATIYTFATYSGMTMGGDAKGSHIQKNNVSRNNSYFGQATNTLDILYGDHQSYLWSKVNLSALIVAFPFTLASVAGAIVDGGLAGVAAGQVYSNYNACNSDLSKAYNLIGYM